MTTRRKELFDIIKKRSFKQGKEFKLVSGRTSSVYFNLKTTLMQPRAAYIIGDRVSDVAFALSCPYVAGMEVGAIPIVTAAAFASCSYNYPIRGLFVRKDKKGYGTNNLIEGLTEDEDIVDQDVLVVEDVTTTGESAFKVAQAINDIGGYVNHVLTIVDREEGAKEFLASKGITLGYLFTKSEFTNEATV